MPLQTLWKICIASRIYLNSENQRFEALFFKHFASRNQLPGFYLIRKLVENELTGSNVLQLVFDFIVYLITYSVVA